MATNSEVKILGMEGTEQLVANFKTLLAGKQDKGASGSGSAIIDVTELPTENIQENAFYRLLKPTFVYNKYYHNTSGAGAICRCVDGLPAVGEPASTDMKTILAYYNTQDGVCYGYIDAALSSYLSVPAGWYTADVLFSAIDINYGGVIETLDEVSEDDTWYLLLDYVLYSYKNQWQHNENIGWKSSGLNAEIFNHRDNIASGDASHAEGSRTEASGDCSHAEGSNTEARGHHSHAEGYGTITNGTGQHVQGFYNVIDEDIADDGKTSYGRAKYAHIVGNGMPDARSNAHTLDWSGNGWFAGDVFVGGSGQDDEAAVKLATINDIQSYVDNAILGGAW